MPSHRGNMLGKVRRRNDAHGARDKESERWQVVLADEDFIEYDDREQDVNNNRRGTVKGE